LNLSFHIPPVITDTTQADLFIEISAQGLSYIILSNNICAALAIYRFDAGITDEVAVGNIHDAIAEQPLLQQRFNKVHIIYSFNQFVLAPHQFMNGTNNNAMLELIYGEANERVIQTDFMYRHAIHIIYGIPTVIKNAFSRYFELAQSTHLFALLPDVLRMEGNQLYCIFSTGLLKILLIKEGKLQLMQNYAYKTPEDVAFYLLNICNSFDVNLNKTMLHLSGMIDERSALYTELYKYFLLIQFESLPAQYQYPEELNQFPAHYFSHLFRIAACV
jgi:hypothetical protein